MLLLRHAGLKLIILLVMALVLEGCGVAGKSVPVPVAVLSLKTGTSSDSPSSSSPRVGGVPSLGPSSIAVTDDGVIVLLDSVRHRLLFYRQQDLVRTVPLPFLDESAGVLLVYGDLFYVTSLDMAYAVDREGRIQQISAKGQEELYPEPRGVVVHLEKGDSTSFGRDRYGNTYTRRLDEDGYVISRQSGGSPQIARERGGAVDTYVASDGAVYVLTWVYTEGDISDVTVTRIMEPVSLSLWQRMLRRVAPGSEKTPGKPAAPEKPATPGTPGSPGQQAIPLDGVPSSIIVERQGFPPLEFSASTDAVLIHNLWQYLSLIQPSGVEPGKPFYRVRAGTGDFMLWSEIVVAGGKAYYWPGSGAIQMLDAALFSPGSLTRLASTSTISAQIEDLPGRSGRSAGLTGSQTAQLAKALAGAFPGGRYEPPQPLEPEFPQYSILIRPLSGTEPASGTEPVRLALAGDRYWVSPGGTVLVDNGELAKLVKTLVPVPELKPGTLEGLYRATRLTLVSGGRANELTRWKNTVVRALLGVGEPGALGFLVEGFDLVFIVDGREERVSVTAQGFTYRGLQYMRRGLTTLAGLMGVP